MSFNKNTWSKDYTGARGLKLLAAADAQRQGFSPKHGRAVPGPLDTQGTARVGGQSSKVGGAPR